MVQPSSLIILGGAIIKDGSTFFGLASNNCRNQPIKPSLSGSAASEATQSPLAKIMNKFVNHTFLFFLTVRRHKIALARKT
jgi:hypothetical protein